MNTSSSPTVASVPYRRRRWEYRSRSAPGGLPWVHVCIGGTVQGRYRLGVARGIVALGDVAIGVVAVGGVAVGLVALGGVALGLAALAGVGVGLVAVGAVAIGVTAFGAVAVAVSAHGAVTPALIAVGKRLPRRRNSDGTSVSAGTATGPRTCPGP